MPREINRREIFPCASWHHCDIPVMSHIFFVTKDVMENKAGERKNSFQMFDLDHTRFKFSLRRLLYKRQDPPVREEIPNLSARSICGQLFGVNPILLVPNMITMRGTQGSHRTWKTWKNRARPGKPGKTGGFLNKTWKNIAKPGKIEKFRGKSNFFSFNNLKDNFQTS